MKLSAFNRQRRRQHAELRAAVRGYTRSGESKIYYSKLPAKLRTVSPRAVHQRLKISPGDRLRFLVDDRGVRIEKAADGADDDSFAAFSEWSTEADEEAFRVL